jgi:hypothetical protein
MQIEKLLQRYARAKALKGSWDKTLKDAYEYALPNREAINQKPEGSNKKTIIYDDTAIIALQKYANRVQSQLTPPNKRWGILEAGTEIPIEQKDDINLKLEEVSSMIFSNLPKSGFTSAMHEAYQDLGISTGVIMCEHGDGITSRFKFRAVPINELVLESDMNGFAKTVWREFETEAETLPMLYPVAKLTDEIKKIISEKPDRKLKLIEGVVYNDKKKNYNHILIYKKDKLIDVNMKSSPYIVFREKKATKETYGRGRILDILPTIKTVNRLSELDLRASDLNANGVWTIADDGVINPYTVKIQAGALIPVDSNNTTNPSIAPLPVATNFAVSMDRIERLQHRINEVMLGNIFGNIEETPIRTATEMTIRQNDLNQTTLSSLARIQQELLEPLIERMVFLLEEQGVLPPIRVDGKEVAIKFTSPISKIQDTEDLQNIGQFLQYAQALPQELVVGTIKVEEIPQYIANKLGVPKSLQRTKAEQDAAKEAMNRTEVQAMQQREMPQQ